MARELILIIEDNEVNRASCATCCASRATRPWKRRVESPSGSTRAFRPRNAYAFFRRRSRRCARTETSSIPVIAVTASAMPEDRKRILEAGFDGMQTKPIYVVDFLSTVERALRAEKGTT